MFLFRKKEMDIAAAKQFWKSRIPAALTRKT